MSEKSILVRRRREHRWVDPDMHTYRDEDHLQGLLKSDPSSVDVHGDHVDRAGGGGQLACRACSEKCRMVLGQVVDYAAAV